MMLLVLQFAVSVSGYRNIYLIYSANSFVDAEMLFKL